MIMESAVKSICCPLLLVLSWIRQANSQGIKMAMNKNKLKSQKLIMLNNIKHLLPTSKIIMTKTTHILTPQKRIMSQSTNQRNQGLLQYLIDLIGLPN